MRKLILLLLVGCGPVAGHGYENAYGGESPPNVVTEPIPAPDAGPELVDGGNTLCTSSKNCAWGELCYAHFGTEKAYCKLKGADGDIGCRPQSQFTDCEEGLHCLDVNGNPETDAWGVCG